jgi:hypothetical protein
MKIIEAMKRVKANKDKINDLQKKINTNAAHLSFENPVYGDKQQAQVSEWLQSALDTSKENVRLLTAISRTNLATPVTIDINEVSVTKSIAEWIWRRREYSAVDLRTMQQLSDRGLKEGNLPSTTGGEPVKANIIRYYDPAIRDKDIAAYASEAAAIDGAMEVVNAITDIIEA